MRKDEFGNFENRNYSTVWIDGKHEAVVMTSYPWGANVRTRAGGAEFHYEWARLSEGKMS